MAEEKRIRVSADTTPLQELREQAMSLYREINQSAATTDQVTEKNLQRLREELSLMRDRNELEKLLLDLRRQAQNLDSQSRQPTIQPSPISEQRDRKKEGTSEPRVNEDGSVEWDIYPEQPSEESETEQQRKSRRKKKKEENRDFITSEPRVNEDGSVEWDVTYEDQEEPEEQPQPRKRRKSRKPQTPSITEERSENIAEGTTIVNDEILREINRHVENIDESVTNRDKSVENVDESQTNIDRSERNVDESKVTEDRHIENVDESQTNKDVRTTNTVENVRNIDRNVENVVENTSYIQRIVEKQSEPSFTSEQSVDNFNPSDNQNNQQSADNNRISRETIDFDDSNIVKALNVINGSVLRGSSDLGDRLQQIVDKIQTPNNQNSSLSLTMTNRYLQTIADIVSRIEDAVIAIDINGRNQGGGGSNSQGSRNNGNIFDPSFFGGGAGGFLGGVLSRLLGPLAAVGLTVSAINNVKDTVLGRVQRNYEFEYQSPMMTSIERQAAETRLEGQNKADSVRWIPLIGDYLARREETASDAMAQAIQISRSTRRQVEGSITPYAQVMGTSTNESVRDMQREGSYAARALGMDFSEYAARQAELIRAGGGTFRGGTDQDPTAVRENQSLMAVERLYGLRNVNQLQSAMRFGDRNENLGGSAVIRAFERAMQRLEIPFAEIASTMDESLQTFASEANKILERQGDFDAGRLTAILTGVREYTGASGRQLERYQQMATGSTLSQDDVTNAIVLRAIRNNTNANTFSEVMAQKEGLANSPDLMRVILKDAQGMTSTNEQFIQVLHEMFTNLSYSDLQNLSQRGGGRIDVDALFEMIKKNESEIGRQGAEQGIEQQYDKSAAAETVGSETAWGKKDIETLLGAVNAIKELISKDQDKNEQFKEEVKEATKNAANMRMPYNTTAPISMKTQQWMFDIFKAIAERFKD